MSYVIRIRASTGRGDPVTCWLTRTARASEAYAAAAHFDSMAEAYDFVRVCGEGGGDEAGPWCEVVEATPAEAARQMDNDTLFRLNNPWLFPRDGSTP